MRARGVFLFLLLFLVSGHGHADGPWSGTWDTRWRDGGARMMLQQDGDHVTGTYPLYGGRIEGTANGQRLDGRWTEGGTEGAFIFVLGTNGHSFAGRYDTGEWWTGARTNTPDLIPKGDLRTPRSTMRSLTVAGNLARAGLSDAWGVVIDTIDFTADPTPATRAQRIERAIELFDLVDLATFRIWTIPDEASGDSLAIELHQPGTDAVLPLTFTRNAAGAWRIKMPSATELSTARHAFLAVFGGQLPATDAFKQLQSPRDTMRAFVQGTAQWDTAAGQALALSTLDLSQLPEVLKSTNGQLAAQYLRRVIDRIGLIGLQSIPNYVADRQPYLHFWHPDGRIVIAPVGEGAETRWKFTPATIADIDRVYVAIEDLPPPVATPPGLIPQSAFFTMRNMVRRFAPALLSPIGEIEYWQLIAVIVIVMTALIGGFIGSRLAFKGLRRLAGPEVITNPRMLAWAIGVVIAVIIASRFVPSLGMPEQIRQFSYPIVGIFATLGFSVTGWELLGIFGYLLAARTERTATTADDILVTLLFAAAKLGIVFAAGLGVAHFLSLPTTGMLAGLGIGGIAVAFASRETISNIFGAAILVSDRPFRRGDWIAAGDVEGSVEHLGIRSTRVRTAQDSVTVVPNGKLADSTINNLGTRRHRLARTRLVVTKGGSPERLDEFVAALRQRILDDPLCVTGRSEVGVTAVTEQGIEIDLTTYLNVSSFSQERAARHALVLDIVRLAADHGLQLGAGMAPVAEPALAH